MATASKPVSMFAAHGRRAPGFVADLADLIRTLKSLFDPYRPELHYMRGPGPAWRAKHAPAPVAIEVGAMPALVRVKA